MSAEALMLGFVIQRLLQAFVVMMVISLLVFLGVYAIGNPIDVLISPDADQRIREMVIRQYGLDLPLWQQYLGFLKRLVAGDFGRSFVFNMPVLDLILSRLPATLELTLAAVLGATLLGVPLGMYAGYKPDGIASKLIMGLSILGFSVPTFWVGLVLIFTFAVMLGWLPAGGRGDTVDAVRRRMELPHARRLAPPVPARAEPRAVQARHDDPPRARRHARGDADRHGEVRARGRRDAKGRSCAATCCG